MMSNGSMSQRHRDYFMGVLTGKTIMKFSLKILNYKKGIQIYQNRNSVWNEKERRMKETAE